VCVVVVGGGVVDGVGVDIVCVVVANVVVVITSVGDVGVVWYWRCWCY